METLERVVVEEHRVLFGELRGEAWSPPAAYRWIRYEDPDPIGRLIRASGLLAAEWAAHPEAREARSRFEAWEAVQLARLDR